MIQKFCDLCGARIPEPDPGIRSELFSGLVTNLKLKNGVRLKGTLRHDDTGIDICSVCSEYMKVSDEMELESIDFRFLYQDSIFPITDIGVIRKLTKLEQEA